jgi:hypothetical protein
MPLAIHRLQLPIRDGSTSLKVDPPALQKYTNSERQVQPIFASERPGSEAVIARLSLSMGGSSLQTARSTKPSMMRGEAELAGCGEELFDRVCCMK